MRLMKKPASSNAPESRRAAAGESMTAKAIAIKVISGKMKLGEGGEGHVVADRPQILTNGPPCTYSFGYLVCYFRLSIRFSLVSFLRHRLHYHHHRPRRRPCRFLPSCLLLSCVCPRKGSHAYKLQFVLFQEVTKGSSELSATPLHRGWGEGHG